ncbi:MAG: tetratricopeptide repeat protein [Gemmatimonadota bacterium]
MDTAGWVRVQELFHHLVELPAAERSRVLAERCGEDHELRLAVEALLRADEGPETVLDRDVAGLAAAMLDRANTLPQGPFGAYRVERLLGEGGMGVVYLGSRDDLGSSAAIKILRDAWLSPARRERFLGEQRTLAQLNHPSIARLYDAGTLADGTPWIAMEYVDGVPLNVWCETNRTPVRGRLTLFRAVCEAVLHAHQNLVIHRDLKPSNVLVRVDGAVRLLDFGIAKHLDADDAGNATRTGLRLMTPAYAAPEQLTGGRPGVQMDVYSLGVMLYELVTGQLPFDLSKLTPGEAEATVINGDAVPPSRIAARNGTTAPLSLKPGEWADLDVLCLTAMHRDPARRYRSVDALIRDVDHFLARQPLDARPDTLGYRIGKVVSRNATVVAVSAVFLIIAVGLAGFYTLRLRSARNAAEASAARTQRIQNFTTSLFQGGDVAAGPAENLRVTTLLENGVTEARGLDSDPTLQADLYENLATIYRQLGLLERSDSLFQAGLASRRRVPGNGDIDLARSILALGDLRIDQARFDEAEILIREALATMRRTLPAGHPDLGGALVTLGRSMSERGSHAQAVAVLDSAVNVLRQSSAGTAEYQRGLTELANAHFYAGNYVTSDSLNREALTLSRQIHGDRHPIVAEDLVNLGATQQERGNYQEAESWFSQALDITRAFYGDSHYRTASNLANLGRSLLLQRRFPEANSALQRSLAIRERVYGADHPSVANTLNELGSAAVMTDSLERAEVAYSRVLDIYRRAYDGDNYRIGVATANLADVSLYRREFRRAELLYREALRIYLATQGPDHLNTGIGYIKLGRSLLRQGRLPQAVEATRAGYGIVGKVASPGISFLQAARLDLSLAFDSLGRADSASHYRAERERHVPAPAAAPASR